MPKLENKLIKCLGIDKSKCIYSNTRVHYVDIRKATHFKGRFFRSLFGKVVQKFYDDIFDIETFDNLIEKYPKGVKKYKKLKTELDYYRYFMTEFGGLIEKQLLKVNPKIRIIIEEFILNEFRKLYNKYGLFLTWESIENYIEYDKNRDRVFEAFAYIPGIFMDMYNLGRIFRSFTSRRGEYANEPQDIVIYTGDWHSVNYKNFFNSIGFKTIFLEYDSHVEITDSDYKFKTGIEHCVNISKLKLPLFIDNESKEMSEERKVERASKEIKRILNGIGIKTKSKIDINTLLKRLIRAKKIRERHLE